MDTKQDLVKRENKSPTGSAASAASEADQPAMIPPVDVTEDDAGITLTADLPGATRESLTIRVDGDTLTLEAPLELGLPKELEAVYAEVRSGRYRRSFTLSRELDSQRIEAALKDGVLTLRLPKLERARPRRIEVRSA
jgi:HSP20 family molecular chaperone IbpA